MRVVIPRLEAWHWDDRKNWGVDRDEMWDGVLHMPPAPNTMHQDLEGQLYAHLLVHWARPRKCRVYQQINLAYPNTDWTNNYRIPDVLLLDPLRFPIDRGSHFAGAPLVVVEIRSPGDETDDKFPFYAGLGVPEVWTVVRDGTRPEVFVLTEGGYTLLPANAGGWHVSPATGVRMQSVGGKLRVQVGDDPATRADLPDE